MTEGNFLFLKMRPVAVVQRPSSSGLQHFCFFVLVQQSSGGGTLEETLKEEELWRRRENTKETRVCKMQAGSQEAAGS